MSGTIETEEPVSQRRVVVGPETMVNMATLVSVLIAVVGGAVWMTRMDVRTEQNEKLASTLSKDVAELKVGQTTMVRSFDSLQSEMRRMYERTAAERKVEIEQSRRGLVSVREFRLWSQLFEAKNPDLTVPPFATGDE